jgi:hypothetical protein
VCVCIANTDRDCDLLQDRPVPRQGGRPTTNKTSTERIVLLDFIHRLVSQKTNKIEELQIYTKISQYTRPQKIAQGSITNHRATYLGAHTHKPLKQVRHRWQ